MPSPLPPIPPVASIDQVVDAIQGIVDWSITNESRLGYFAALMNHELDLIADGLVVVRDSAWHFARLLASQPGFIDPTLIRLHDLKVAGLGKLILDPPGLLLSHFIEVIGAAESRDIVKNIQVLNVVANAPAPMTKTAAAKI